MSMEIARLFSSIGFKINEADIRKVDQQINAIGKKLQSLSANIRVKLAPVADELGSKVAKTVDPDRASKLKKLEESNRKDIAKLESAMKSGLDSEALQAVMNKLSMRVSSLESNLKAQGRPFAASSVRGASSSKESSLAKTTFGQRQGTIRNLFKEFELSSEISASKIKTAFTSLAQLQRTSGRFTDPKFQVEGFRSALMNVNRETRKAVQQARNESGSAEQELKALRKIASKLERKLEESFQRAGQLGISKLKTDIFQDILKDKRLTRPEIEARQADPLKVEDKIATLASRSEARQGFKSIKEKEDLEKSLSIRLRQLDRERSALQKKLISDDIRIREIAAQRIKKIEADITNFTKMQTTARTRAILSSNEQAKRSFRELANVAFNSLNKIRIIATTATGVMASFVGITPFLNANRTMQEVEAAFKAITGNAKEAQMMIKFVNSESERLGLNYGVVVKASKQLTAAAVAQGVELNTVKEILTGTFEAARVLSLNSDDVTGSIRAMSQMFSKGTVMAEELKQQLGERFPNAIALSAKAMGMSTKELLKSLQRGEVMAKDLLPKLAKEFRAFAASGLDEALVSFAAESDRAGKAMFDFFVGLGKAGALDVVTSLIRGFTQAIKGLTPVAQATMRVLAPFLKLLVAPIEAIGRALSFIAKLDKGMQSIMETMKDTSNPDSMRNSIIDLTKSILSLNTALGLLIFLPFLGKIAKAFAIVASWIPIVSKMIAGMKALGAAILSSSIAARIATPAIAGLFKTISAGFGAIAAMAQKALLPILGTVLAVEEVVSVIDPNKNSKVKDILNAEDGLFSGIAKTIVGPFEAAILALDTGMSLLLGDADLARRSLAEKMGDIFKIDVDHTKSIQEQFLIFADELQKHEVGIGGFFAFVAGEFIKVLATNNPMRLAAGIVDNIKGMWSDFNVWLSGQIDVAANIVSSWTDSIVDGAMSLGRRWWTAFIEGITSVGTDISGFIQDKLIPDISISDDSLLGKIMGRFSGGEDLTQDIPTLDRASQVNRSVNSQVDNRSNTINMTTSVSVSNSGASPQDIADTVNSAISRSMNGMLVQAKANAPMTE